MLCHSEDSRRSCTTRVAIHPSVAGDRAGFGSSNAMETTKIVIGTAILLLVASTPFFAWRLGRKHGWSRLVGGGAALVGFMVYRNHVASTQSIGPGWVRCG